MQLMKTLHRLWSEAADQEIRVQLIVMVGAIFLMVFLEPFGTSVWSFPEKLFYWSIAIPAGFVGSLGFDRWLHPLLLRKGVKSLSVPARILCIALAATLVILLLEAVVREPVPLRYVLFLFGSVVGLSIAIWGVVSLGLGAVGPKEVEGEDPAFAAFQGQWPPELRGAALYALAAEDHYIRLYTGAGEALIAGRFAEALKAVAGQPGTQTHRSWWIAGDAVETLDRAGGKWVLQLKGGLKAPVSRRFRPEVRAMGWDRLGG